MREKFLQLRIYPNLSKRNQRSKKIPLYIKLRYNGKKKESRLHHIYDLSENEYLNWNRSLMRISFKTSKTNNYLNYIQNNFEEYLNQNFKIKRHSFEEILANITGNISVENRITTIGFVKEVFNSNISIRNDLKKGSIRNYHKAINNFEKFIKYNNLDELLLMDFKFKNADDFKLFLGFNLKNSNVSSLSNIKRIKTIFKIAINRGLINKNPFDNIKFTSTNENRTPSLTILEFTKIYTNQRLLIDNKLGYYRDLFIFSCLTGLSFCDLLKLSQDDIKQLDKGYVKIDTSRQKTNRAIIQVIPDIAKIYVEKYIRLNKDKKEIFPRIALETYNEKLKLIGEIAGIDVNLTSKVSRTTCNQIIDNAEFSNTYYKMKYMGWSTTKNIQMWYTTIQDSVLIANANKINIYLSKELSK
jgi:integrase